MLGLQIITGNDPIPYLQSDVLDQWSTVKRKKLGSFEKLGVKIFTLTPCPSTGLLEFNSISCPGTKSLRIYNGQGGVNGPGFLT
jgi:hypothetical protein